MQEENNIEMLIFEYLYGFKYSPCFTSLVIKDNVKSKEK